MKNIMILAALVAFAPAANAQFCDGNSLYAARNASGQFVAVCQSDFGSFVDEFPCGPGTDGQIGVLGWQTVGTITVSLPCGGDNGTSTGGQSIVPNAGDTATGIVLARRAGTNIGTISNPATAAWAVQWRFKVLDLDEIVVKVGIGDEIATESVDHAAANQDFIGVIFKDEDADTGGECGGTTGDSANWQFHSVKAGTSAGLQDSGVAATTSTFLWMRAHSTPTGVEICVESTDGAPTSINHSGSWGGSGRLSEQVVNAPPPAIGVCYEETNSANISVSNLSPFLIVSSCDGSAAGGNANRIEIDYASLTVGRY